MFKYSKITTQTPYQDPRPINISENKLFELGIPKNFSFSPDLIIYYKTAWYTVYTLNIHNTSVISVISISQDLFSLIPYSKCIFIYFNDGDPNFYRITIIPGVDRLVQAVFRNSPSKVRVQRHTLTQTKLLNLPQDKRNYINLYQ
jgi:hypothetical protein